MLSPAGITSRLDRLVGVGLVERSPDPDDRRSWLIRLSRQGKRKVDAAVTDHVANEERLLAPLTRFNAERSTTRSDTCSGPSADRRSRPVG